MKRHIVNIVVKQNTKNHLKKLVNALKSPLIKVI